MITKPEMPPREGYIEVEDESGNHVYRKTEEQIEKEKTEAERDELKAENASLKSQLNDNETTLATLLETVLPSLTETTT